MKTRHFAAALIAFATATTAGVRAAEPTGDLARLQGKWATAVATRNGQKITIILEFKGDRLSSMMGDGPDSKPTVDQRVVLDETASPKKMDLVDGRSLNAKPGSMEEKFVPPDAFAIYELDGDTLKMATILLGKKRPTQLAAAPGVTYAVYTRGEIPKELAGAASRAGMAATKGAPPVLKGDLAALQGTWTTGDGVFHGPGKETMTVQGENLVVVGRAKNGVELRFQSRIKLNEQTAPKAIDFLGVRNGSRAAPDAVGIYALDGDTLTLHKSGRGRPRSKVFETGSESGQVATWTRGTVVVRGGSPIGPRPETKEMAPKRAAGPGDAQEFRGATVVSFTPRQVVLRTADGGQVTAMFAGARGFDIDGKPMGRGDALMKVGNVIDVTVEPIPTSKIGLQQIKEFRLVRGETVQKEAGTEGGTIEDAVVKVFPYRVTFQGAGKELHASKNNPRATAFGLGGKPLPAGSADRLLKEGNRVSVVVSKKDPRALYSRIIEIRLLEGELLDPAR